MQHPILALGIGLPQGGEWLVIALALLLIFGKRLPEVMRSLGSGVNEFKKGMAGEADHRETAAPPPNGSIARPPAIAAPPAPPEPERR